MAKTPVQFRLNGSDRAAFVAPADNLLTLLRRGLNEFGPKYGCGQGTCGTCTVLVDGKPVNSCLMLGVEADGCKITTVEGLADDGRLHPLQQCFLEGAALQCGICTPGFLVAAKALLDKHPKPTEEQVRFELSNNLCRCTGYDKIVKAVMAAAK